MYHGQDENSEIGEIDQPQNPKRAIIGEKAQHRKYRT